jgi:hypothetical protein
MMVRINTNHFLSLKKEYMQADCCPDCEAKRLEAIRLESIRRQKEIKTHMDSLFNFNLPYYFINRVEEFNAIFGQQQIENISTTLNLIDNNKYDKLDVIKKSNIQKCIQWCQQHGFDYNNSLQQNNIFLMNKKV